MMSLVLNVAKDFSKFPAGRKYTDGKWSGEQFLKELLIPALYKSYHVTINLDGTLGYGSSWLQEIFGNLNKFNNLHERLTIISKQDPSLIDECWGYIWKL